MKRITTVLMAAALLAGTGCNKKEKHNQPIGVRPDMLGGASWRLVDVKDNGANRSSGCKMDDIWTFNDGGTGMKDDNADRCNIDEQTSTFKWFISGDQRILEIYEYTGTDYGVQLDTKWMDWEITYMTEDEFDIKYYAVIDGLGHSYELSFARTAR